MKISDISIEDVRKGTNWKFNPPDNDDWVDLSMEEWASIVPSSKFNEEDDVLYSGLVVLNTGEVAPTVCLKEVGSPEYGGDSCWYLNGQWIPLGHMKASVDIVEEYTASPLPQDPSFDSDDGTYRNHHQEGFHTYSARISGDIRVEFRPYQPSDYE